MGLWPITHGHPSIGRTIDGKETTPHHRSPEPPHLRLFGPPLRWGGGSHHSPSCGFELRSVPGTQQLELPGFWLYCGPAVIYGPYWGSVTRDAYELASTS